MTLTYIRPDADDTDGTWTNESDSGSNLFASIDETVADDNDYIKSVHLPDHDICKIRLSDPSGMVMRPATVHYRFKKRGETTQQINLDVSLLQGSTEIASWSESDIGTAYVDGSQALSVDQFNAISDFTNLYLQFDAFSAWWLANSSVDLSFETGLYYDSSYATATDSAHLLLHCDGADASTTFIDATGRHQVGIAGSAQIDTAQSKFGGASALFNAGRLSLDSGVDFLLGTGDFTVDFWVRFSDRTGAQGFWESDVANPLICIRKTSGHVFWVYANGITAITGTTVVVNDTWYHVAVTRSSGSTRLFINGTQEGSTYSDSNNYALTSTDHPYFGSAFGEQLLGWLDEIRVLKGTAAWTTTFTPPTAPYNVALSGPYAHLSCSRASVGYATTSSGTLTQFAVNALRITDLGLLVEDARTNLNINSQAINATNYTTIDTTFTDNAAVAPDGTTTMSQVFDSATSNRHIFQRSGIANTPATKTLSIFVKDVDRRYFVMEADDGSFAGGFYLYADLQAGTITDSGTWGTGATLISATIEAYANGVYRLALAGTITSITFFICALSDRATKTGSLIGAEPSYLGTGKSVYVWGMQVEDASFVSSYIPTTSAAATRAADVVKVIGNLDNVLSTVPHSDVIDVRMNIVPTTTMYMVTDSSGNPADLALVSSDTNLTSVFGSAFSATLGTGLFSTGVKVAVGVASGSSSLVGGGGSVTTPAAGSAMTSGNIYFGSVVTSGFMYGYFRRATFWTSKLADATLQGFTNP